MSAERDDLQRLVAELPDEQVMAALADVRRRLVPRVDRPWPPIWFGAATGSGTRPSTRLDEPYIDGVGRSAESTGDTAVVAVAETVP